MRYVESSCDEEPLQKMGASYENLVDNGFALDMAEYAGYILVCVVIWSTALILNLEIYAF